MRLAARDPRRNQLIFTGIGIAVIASVLFAALAHEKPESYFDVIAVTAVLGFVATLPMRALFRYLWEKPPMVLAAGLIAACYGLAALWRVLHNLLYWNWVKDGWRPEHALDYVSSVMGSFYVLLCWSGLYFGIKYYQQL